MKKKHIQLLKYIHMLLAVNFCLTATGIANADDIDESDDSNFVFLDKDEDNEIDFEQTPEPSLEDSISEELNLIWDGFNKINEIYQHDYLKKILLKHKQESFVFDDQIPEDALGQKLIDQFAEILSLLPDLQIYKISGQIPSEDVIQINRQLKNIGSSLKSILDLYSPKSLTKEFKAFLSDEVEEIMNFLYDFTSKPVEESDPSTSSSIHAMQEISQSNEEEGDFFAIQELLESCEEEDDIIYTQYETVINAEKTNIEKFLASSQANESSFLYFNEDENLIEINHTKDGRSICTTIWQIRGADKSLVTWNENDPITIAETGLFSRYSLFGERLDYTLSNNRSSVRANFMWKSTPKNTYNVVGVDHYENAVFLEKGLCLFVVEGDLEAWHPKDQVLLEKSSSSLNTEAKHRLINITRNKEVKVSLTKSSTK